MSICQILHANAMPIPLRDNIVQAIVTSPPYYGLRDYQTPGQFGLEALHDCYGAFTGQPCGDCWICHMRQVFAECHRILHPSGVLFVNIGDSYSGSWGNYHPHSPPEKHGQRLKKTARWNREAYNDQGFLPPTARPQNGMKPKDLMGMPWRLALALQQDGWWLRNDIIWHKPNAMPTSAQDRASLCHEYVFLLTKSQRYHWDTLAAAEPAEWVSKMPDGWNTGIGGHGTIHPAGREKGQNIGAGGQTRVPRTVWTIPTEPTSLAHFATFPQALVRKCLEAVMPKAGVCPTCRCPWARQREKTGRQQMHHSPGTTTKIIQAQNMKSISTSTLVTGYKNTYTTAGFVPTCRCGQSQEAAIPGLVFDPFVGSGTTLLVARAMGYAAIGTDISWDYLKIARERLGLKALERWLGMDNRVPQETHSDLPLFQ